MPSEHQHLDFHAIERKGESKMSKKARSLKPRSGTVSMAIMETEVILQNCPTREDIAALAYSYWEARGFQGGSPQEDWLRAEQELRSGRPQPKN
jgi:hypothetical protein